MVSGKYPRVKKRTRITSKKTVRMRKIDDRNRACLVWREHGKIKQRVLNDRRKKQAYGENTLFKNPRYTKYNEIVSFKNPEAAEKSVSQLEHEYRIAERKDKKLRIARVTQYSSNRAYAISLKEDLSDTERKEFRKIGRIYKKSARKMWKNYNSLK